MIVLAPDLAEDGYTKQLERVLKIIEDGGGTIVNDDRWGIRSLAYPIRKYDQGYYGSTIRGTTPSSSGRVLPI
jgi:small subunit ribosomal protein S6